LIKPWLLSISLHWRVLMVYILRQFKQLLFTTAFALGAVTVMSQVKHQPQVSNPVSAAPVSNQLRDFYKRTNDAGVVFMFPPEFKEVSIPNEEDFSFDYAMELPDSEFEIWFQVKPQKDNWVNYQRYKNDPARKIANPDLLYISMAHAQAVALKGEEPYFSRSIAKDVLKRYNADAGRSFLLNLNDAHETKHYRYALLLTLQKNHVGTILAICFTNEKNADFFKKVNRMSRYIKFKS
jgi:hypothetical protein